MNNEIKKSQADLIQAIKLLEGLVVCTECGSKKRVNHWVGKVKICHTCYNRKWIRRKRSKDTK